MFATDYNYYMKHSPQEALSLFFMIFFFLTDWETDNLGMEMVAENLFIELNLVCK